LVEPGVTGVAQCREQRICRNRFFKNKSFPTDAQNNSLRRIGLLLRMSFELLRMSLEMWNIRTVDAL
jgi:hypothetical protein